MALTLTKETGAGSASSNAYCDFNDFQTYLESHLYANAAENTTVETQEAALVWATRLLDEHVSWDGTPTQVDQALQWPRIGVMKKGGRKLIDHNSIPQWLIDATCELARHLISEDRTAEDDTTGFTRIKVDVIELEVDKTDRDDQILPKSVRSIVMPYGTVVSSGSMARLMRV